MTDMSNPANWHRSATIGEHVTITPGYNDTTYIGTYAVHSIMRSEHGTVTDYRVARPGFSSWELIVHVSRVIPNPFADRIRRHREHRESEAFHRQLVADRLTSATELDDDETRPDYFHQG